MPPSNSLFQGLKDQVVRSLVGMSNKTICSEVMLAAFGGSGTVISGGQEREIPRNTDALGEDGRLNILAVSRSCQIKN